MKISIIIPTYNEEEFLPNLLKSISRQNFNDLEVIIADAHSTDKTIEIAKSYNCKIVPGGLPGIGRNNGARVAQGELLLFLDADSVLTNNYITSAIEEFELHNLGIAITQIVPLEKGFINQISHEFANYMTKQISYIKPHGAGCYGILTYKSLHEKVNGFDEHLDFGEDTDYIERIGKISRFKVLSNPRLLVSTRRLEEEGLSEITKKYAKSTAKQMMGKTVTLNELDYSFEHGSNQNKRIFYSLCGEGMGHAIRSGVVIEYLINEGYDLIVFASSRAYDYLNSKFDNIYEIGGFNTVYENNSVRNKKTFVYNMKEVPSDLKNNIQKMNKLAKKFKPDLIISDFEFYANLLSHILRIPMISIDNMHVLTEANYSSPNKYIKDRIFSEAVVHAFIQKANRTLIYSYFFPPLKDTKTTQYIYPIIRDEIYKLKPSVGEHVLVYQTSNSNNDLIKVLKSKPDQEFIVYGFYKDERDSNILYRKFNEDVLYNDFKDAKCVITNGGFSLITEALQLEKPILSIPVNKQFEQILNAIYLERLGYGEHHDHINQRILENFLENVPKYRQNIVENYEKHENNTETLETLKTTIEDVLK
ncbi:MJ1255/VC2487 family glycosyltransferase [Methanosphaera sp. WGK6]|uniref:MJ1255/VC2487 family glycosyltransferase n=1 Tax=Methanosphaera sp. WGK6 TaxID=1561964 RepID=UPI00084BE546|nr:MJ1255/VC2487 family glycosyltransferase [Methanosphaera sp. WGK6]OED29670.1 teichoic acid biosynthesis protein [Methanosphaera sp. WGK6]